MISNYNFSDNRINSAIDAPTSTWIHPLYDWFHLESHIKTTGTNVGFLYPRNKHESVIRLMSGTKESASFR